jgi:hypothetical protein
MFKIGSREWWTLDGKHIYFVSLPEYAAASVKSFFTSLLIAAGFYATKCGCKHGHAEKPLKFRLNRRKDCRRRQIKEEE